MSFEYINISRTKVAIELGLRPACEVFDPCVLVWWLDATLEMYRRGNTLAVLSNTTLAFVDEHRKAAKEALAALSAQGRLLLTSAISAYETHLYKDIDKNLLLIGAAYEHGTSVGSYPTPHKSIRYTLKKHRDNKALRLMTVRSDILKDFGFEGACLVMDALTRAVRRATGFQVSICNLHELLDGHDGSRASPDYVNTQVFFLRRHLVTYLCHNLPLDELKKSLGLISTLHDYFVTLEVG